jgi:hypothetical protein
MKSCLALVGAMGSLVSNLALAQTYFANPVPTSLNAVALTTTSLNSSGTVAATQTSAAGVVSSILLKGTSVTHLGTMNNSNPVESAAISFLSDAGTGAGIGQNASSFDRGIYWDTSGRGWELVPVADRHQSFKSEAAGVSGNGILVGSSEIGDSYGSTQATLWFAASGGTAIPMQSCNSDPTQSNYNGIYDQALAISPSGKYAAGNCGPLQYDDTFYAGAARWKINSDGTNTVTRLAELGEAASVNNNGTAVGMMYGDYPPVQYAAQPCDVNGCPYAAVFALGQAATALPQLVPGTAGGMAQWINNAGLIVGSSTLADGRTTRAVIWSADGQTVTDLNRSVAGLLPGVVLVSASRITENGLILAQGVNAKNLHSDYVLTPAVAIHSTLVAQNSATAFHQPVSLRVTVSAVNGAVPAGTILWYAGPKYLGSSPLDTSGKAAYTSTEWQPGFYSLGAYYVGSAPYAANWSNTVPLTVNRSATRLTLSSTTDTPTHGRAFILVAAGQASYGTIAGTVNFYADGKYLGTSATDARGAAGWTVTLPTAGQHVMSAGFNRNPDFDGAASNYLTVTVK